MDNRLKIIAPKRRGYSSKHVTYTRSGDGFRLCCRYIYRNTFFPPEMLTLDWKRVRSWAHFIWMRIHGSYNIGSGKTRWKSFSFFFRVPFHCIYGWAMSRQCHKQASEITNAVDKDCCASIKNITKISWIAPFHFSAATLFCYQIAKTPINAIR